MVDTTAVLGETLKTLIENKKFSTIRDMLETMNPSDIAGIFQDFSDEKLPVMFRLLPKELAAEVFVEMDSDQQELLIRSFSDTELKEVVDELYVDDAADIVEEMPANVVKRILRQADPEMRKMINEVLNYPEDSAGSIMTTEYVSLRPKMTVQEAFKRIKRTGIDKETVYTCYVISDDRMLLGYVSLRSLLLADEDEKIEEIMDPNVISVCTTDDQEEVARAMSKYNFMALPVTDKEGRLVGIVTIDDALDVIEEETTEDMEKMAAIMSSDDKPYLKTGVIELWKARIPWLLFLMISATFTGIIITNFEDSLKACAVLTAFIPMLMDTGGNTGSQASVTVVRALTLGQVEFSDVWKIIWKEIRVAVICGITLAVVGFLKIFLIDRMLMNNYAVTLPVEIVICSTLFFTVICAKITGCTLPLIAQKAHLDPAVMASPFITTIVDVISLIIYFGIAKLILGI